jgi:glycosyltransferase involved in cell wall biosynthesis
MKLLLHSNKASHYRAQIYQMMDKEFNCDFCFGDDEGANKKMDYSLLSGDVYEIHSVDWGIVEFQLGMVNLLKKDYDTYVIYGAIRCVSTWLFLIARKIFYPSKRVFGWSHGMLGKEGHFKRLLYKTMFRMMTGAFIYNERSTKLMLECGIPDSKLHTIYNSLAYDKQLPLRLSLKPSSLYQDHFGNNFKNIVFIGRLTKVKRFDLLLDAVAELKTHEESFNLTFIGDGVERHNMEQRVNELGIRDQVWFFGACYDERTNAELIYNADLCVSPGNIGLTAMHVLMFGCPAITNDDFNHQMPEFEAIQEGISGSFFKVGDSSSLAATISKWFSAHKNDREEVRNACYKEIDTKWNPHNQIRVFKEVLLAAD